MTEAKSEKIDIKKQLGNPKITFVIGGPASGKGTQCAKLVEEFGYTHISTGDLFRAEQEKGTKEGDRIRKIMEEGGLVPSEITVDILVKAMIATPSQNYLIDGFPREIQQAVYFEQKVCPAQTCLFFNVSNEVCLERCLGRAQGGSDRADDKQEVLLKRLENFQSQTMPVVELYRKFGKVREVNGEFDELTVYEATRKAMLPQVSFLIGPQASGKTTIGTQLCKRTNQKLLCFEDFCEENKLQDKDDETVICALIKELSNEVCPNVMIEGFPQTQFQAKFFIKNCVAPFRVFALQCSKDTCQERMIQVGASADNYMVSTILAKRIRQYNENCQQLLPYLEKETNLRVVDAEQTISQACAQICSYVEPCILHVRVGGSESAQYNAKKICEGLREQKGYFELDINALIRDEMERKTDIGCETHKLHSMGQDIPHHLIVLMLRQIIYSGDCTPFANTKFLLNGFPETPEAVHEFESTCCKLTAIIYAAGPDAQVEILNNNLNNFNIDSLFAKDNRLKTLKQWDPRELDEQLGFRTDWGMVTGRSLSGKTTIAGIVAQLAHGKIIDMAKMAEKCKDRLGTEDEPFEGDVPLEEVEKDVVDLIQCDKKKGETYMYIIDGYLHQTEYAFMSWFSGHFGGPSFHLFCTVDKAMIEARFKERNEMDKGADLEDDQKDEIDQKGKAAIAEKAMFDLCLKEFGTKTRIKEISTEASLELTWETLRSFFCAKIILINHEYSLPVDTPCANLAIKFNMLYVSVYQLIKENIEKRTPLGKKLLASHQPRALQPSGSDQAMLEFCAVHYDLPTVMQLIQETIMAKRTDQQFILLEGLCNACKFANFDDMLEMRQMDELFHLEKSIGEVNSVISLLYNEEPTKQDDIKIQPKVEVVVEVKVKKERVEGDDEEEEEQVEEPVEEDDGEEKVVKFNPGDFEWTITNGQPKNLPQLFREFKPNSVYEKFLAEDLAKTTHEGIAQGLDDFCNRLVNDGNGRNFFRQVIFKA